MPVPSTATVTPFEPGPVEPSTPTSEVFAPAGPAGGVTAEVRYRKHPLVFDPRLIRAGMSGTVQLRVLIDREGKPAKIELEKSSGYPQLDASARSQVRSWLFEPAVVNGEEVEVTAIIPVRFSLDRG